MHPDNQQQTASLIDSDKEQDAKADFYRKQQSAKSMCEGLRVLSEISHGQDLTELVKKYITLLLSL